MFVRVCVSARVRVCVDVCDLCVSTCPRVHVCTRACAWGGADARLCGVAGARLRVYVFMHVCVHVHDTHVCACARVCMCTRVYVRGYLCVCAWHVCAWHVCVIVMCACARVCLCVCV